MRTPNPIPIPIRRVVRGTDWLSRPFKPQNYPISPSIENLLSTPTWSVRSLLPPLQNTLASKAGSQTKASKGGADEVTRDKLHHLLKLSALPLPKSEAEESKMLQTLRNQVHFVKSIQSVDTTGIEPLITIRDETNEAVTEETITLEKMLPYLELEEKVGVNGTVRRRDVVRSPEQDRAERATWEVDVGDLGVGSEKRRRGKYFYVRRSKDVKQVKNAGTTNEQQELAAKKPVP